MSIEPGYSGQEFLEGSYERIARTRELVDCFVQVDGGVNQDNIRTVREAGADLIVVGNGDLLARGSAAGLQTAGTSTGMSLERAVELAESAKRRAYPKPTVGAVVVADGEVVGEGVTEEAGRARRDRGARSRRRTRPRRDALRDDGAVRPPRHDAAVRRRRARRRDLACRRRARSTRTPRRGAGSSGSARAASRSSIADSFEARRQNEAWRTWVALGRPFVTYKAAMTLDGRVTVPGERWVSGEASRRRVHELRAASDAVAVGMGTVRLENPRLDARDVDVKRQPRRLAFGSGPLPDGSELELRSGPLEDELRALAAEGVQSLLLEGGPTLARAFLEAGLVDKLLLFVAPMLSGAGPRRPRRARRAGPADAADESAGRRGRSPRGVPPRAVTSESCSPGSCGRLERSRPSRTGGSCRGGDGGRDRRLDRDRRCLPDGRREVGRVARVRRRARDVVARQVVRRPRQRRAGAPGGRSARRPPGARPCRRHRNGCLGRDGSGRRSRADRSGARAAPLLRREGIDHRRRRLAHRRRGRRDGLRGGADPAHARGHDARRARRRETRSTSRPTSLRSTSKSCSPVRMRP